MSSKPNFKKKNTSQEINLAQNQHLKRSTVESNLSIMDNFQESQSGLNSNMFNEGSSISEIIAEDQHNPESTKKL